MRLYGGYFLGQGAKLGDLLAAPTVEKGTGLMALVESFKDWGIRYEQSLSRFIRDNELAWLNGTLPPEAM